MANFIRGFIYESAKLLGALTAICVFIGGLFLTGYTLGAPFAKEFVKTVVEPYKYETIEHVDLVRQALQAVRGAVSEITEDRKQLSKKREEQFEAVRKQINDLSLKVEGTNQRISTQIEWLVTLVARLNTQLDSLNGRLPLRMGSGATKYQDRITADEAPQ